MKYVMKHNKGSQYIPFGRGTAKTLRLFVQSLRSFLHKNTLHFGRPCCRRYESSMLRALFLLFTLIPSIGFAEVSDKMATISELWLQGLIVGTILFLLVRWSHWFSVLATVVVIFFFIASQKTFTDPYIGPAIMQEQGNPYKVASYGSVGLMAFGFLCGLFLNSRRRKNAS